MNNYQITTLEGLADKTIVGGRRQGNTTRLVDSAIQDLFSGAKIKVLDHYDNGQNSKANLTLYNKILDRLNFEHKITTKFGNSQYKLALNRSELTIELVERMSGYQESQLDEAWRLEG